MQQGAVAKRHPTPVAMWQNGIRPRVKQQLRPNGSYFNWLLPSVKIAQLYEGRISRRAGTKDNRLPTLL